jgi:hypothetical protein
MMTDLCEVVLLIARQRARLGPPPLLLQRLARRCRAGDVCSRAVALLRLRQEQTMEAAQELPLQDCVCVLA